MSGDGTGVPMRQEELEGRAGKQPDGGAKTRMAYLGCVFTQHKQDEKGHPVRDHDSTTYVSSFDSIDQFGPLLRQEAIRRGLPLALQIVLLIVNNVARMQYGTFRRKGFFIGSGVVEAGCKTVIGARCKQSGMFWGRPGAQNVLA